jgi:tetratricopeptide (TPR) repeat protein
VAAAIALGVWLWRNPPRYEAPDRESVATPSLAPPSTPRPPSRISVEKPPLVLRLPEREPSPPPVAVPAAGVDAPDAATANALADRLEAKQTLTAGDIATAEELLSRYPKERPVRNLLTEVLLAVALQEQKERRFGQAAIHARRAAALSPDSPRPRLALMDVMLEASDWPAAEAAAREALVADPRSPEAWRGLGYALLRQDRNREAEEALRAALELREDSWARNLLDRLQKQAVDERGMTEQKLSRFNVRYDGDAHEDVGREILRVLERHYATLVRVLDHEVKTPIPVVLFTQQSYYDATGAPAWSGGQYNHFDGRIRVPIGGLTPSLTSDIDNVLVHELTHAFVADLSGGKAPRDVQEGFAQYMEGKRIGSLLTDEQAAALASGRAQGVGGFYLSALAFAEYLVAQRGQGGVNDLLKAMAETGNVDEAFRRVYGRDHAGTREAWQQRFRQQHGS